MNGNIENAKQSYSQRCLKVLHFVSNISIGNGIMSVLMSYYRNINKEQIQFDFVYFDSREKTYASEIKHLGGRTIKLESVTNYFNFRRSFIAFCKANSGKYQIIEVHDYFMFPFIFDIRKRLGVDKIIIHSHNTKYSDHLIGTIRNRLLSIPNNFIPDYYFACSQEAGNFAFGEKFLKNGIVINNAIDISKFYCNSSDRDKIRNDFQITDELIIGHIGGFRPQKNHNFIIDIFKEVLKQVSNAKLMLVSEGPLKTNVENRCVKEGLKDKVCFLGVRDDINSILNSFDVFLLPSIYEGLGIVLIEAQAVGIPCVYSDTIPRVTNILTEFNEVLSLRDSPKSWADAIMRAYRKNRLNRSNRTNRLDDDAYIKRMLQLAGFDIKIEAKKLEEIYTSMVL